MEPAILERGIFNRQEKVWGRVKLDWPGGVQREQPAAVGAATYANILHRAAEPAKFLQQLGPAGWFFRRTLHQLSQHSIRRKLHSFFLPFEGIARNATKALPSDFCRRYALHHAVHNAPRAFAVVAAWPPAGSGRRVDRRTALRRGHCSTERGASIAAEPRPHPS